MVYLTWLLVRLIFAEGQCLSTHTYYIFSSCVHIVVWFCKFGNGLDTICLTASVRLSNSDSDRFRVRDPFLRSCESGSATHVTVWYCDQSIHPIGAHIYIFVNVEFHMPSRSSSSLFLYTLFPIYPKCPTNFNMLWFVFTLVVITYKIDQVWTLNRCTLLPNEAITLKWNGFVMPVSDDYHSYGNYLTN